MTSNQTRTRPYSPEHASAYQAPSVTSRGLVSGGLTGSGYLMVRSIIGIVWAACLITLLAVGISTIILVFGAAILIATARLVHEVDAAEARRAAHYLGEDPSRFLARREIDLTDSASHTSFGRLRHAWQPETVQRALAAIVRVVTGSVTLSITVALWAVPLSLLSAPILAWVGLEPTAWINDFQSTFVVDEWPASGVMPILGVATIPVSLALLRMIASAQARRAVNAVTGRSAG